MTQPNQYTGSLIDCPTCGQRTPARLDYGSLLTYMQQRWPGISQNGIARQIGMYPQLVSKWAHRDWLSIDTAETVADRLGVYPSSIWPLYDQVAAA